MAMQINLRTKNDLIKKAEHAYLKLKENRKELTKTQEETKEKLKGQIMNVPRGNLFEISQVMDHFTKYSRRNPSGEPLSEARLLHYGIRMVYSDTNMDKNTRPTVQRLARSWGDGARTHGPRRPQLPRGGVAIHQRRGDEV